MTKCEFNKVVHRHGCAPVNLLHIFRTPFLRNTNVGLRLSRITKLISINENLCYMIFTLKFTLE